LIPQIVRLEGELNFKAFSKAFQQLIDRHESLRTVFVQDQEGSPRQIVKCSTDLDCNVKFFDFSELTLTQIQDIIENTISNEINIGFNLEKGPLIRCVLIKETSGLHIWMLLMHHIISDGISMGVIRSEWSEFYNAEMGKRPPNMEPLSIQYKDYSAWHNAYLKSPQIESHKAYWLERFNGEIPILHLYSDNARPEISTYKGKTIYRTLDQGSSDRLKQYTQNQGGTLFITLQTILTIFLHKYTGQEDIVIGSPIAGREHPDLDGQVGFYVNTLALRNEFKKENTVSELYQQIKQNTLSAFSHQVFPYDELVDLLKLKRDVSRNPLFDVMLAFQSSQFSESDLKFERLLISDYALSNDYQVAKFDLSFGFEEHNTGINYSLNYNCDIYTERQIQHFLDHLLFILETIDRCDQVSISNYDILLDSDKKYLLEGLNDTKSDFPKDNTIVDLFLSQVQMTSSEVAIKYENIEISYQQLNELSNELSHYLLYKYEIKPNDLIGIELEHSEWMIISLLAILKCGAAYVPIDPEYPDERKQFIKKDAKLELIISDQELIDFKKLHQKEQFPSTNPHVDIDPANLAYIIYTSGSTGVPKGCMVTHTSLVNYIDWIKVYNKGEQYNVVDIFSSLSFDFTVTSLFGGLTLGKTLRLHSSKEDLSNVLHTIVLDPKSAWIKLTPAHIKLIDESVLKSAGSKIFIIGGEALTTDQILHLQKNEDCVIYNEYGPTEATVGCIVKKIATAAEPFIGKPIQNTEVILLDESDRLVPFGSIGEICISGVCLSKGYLNRPELTAEKFKNHPYKAHEQIYRTGDLGRWREDGDLEYHGRIDEQVKIRGYRIELGEIEHVLTGISNIGQVIVIARVLKEGTEKELIAYYTGKASAEDLRVYLQSKIPHYMIPGYYVQLDKIPLTHNGKVDRKKLPDPEGTGFAKAIYEAPKTEVERKLVEIWAQVLNIKSEELSVKSDFFQLGGNSINAIKLIISIRKIFGIKLMLSDFLLNNDLYSLARFIENLKNQDKGNFEIEL
jgi:amino acid adenylation domain-containing protein